MPDPDKKNLDRLKEKTARLSIISNTGLVILKFVVGLAIGSVSIISEAIHSMMDLVAAVIAFFAVRKSAEPPIQNIRLVMGNSKIFQASSKRCLFLSLRS